MFSLCAHRPEANLSLESKFTTSSCSSPAQMPTLVSRALGSQPVRYSSALPRGQKGAFPSLKNLQQSGLSDVFEVAK